MRVELPDALDARARARSHRLLLWTVLLAVVVVAAAGVSGTTSFSGPRWLPNLSIAPASNPTRTQQLPAAPPGRPASGKGSFPLWVVWIIVGIAAIIVVALLWRWWAGRRSGAARNRHSVVTGATTSEPPIEPEPEPDTPALRTGIELALQVLDEQREPADAIVRAWLGLQETAEQSGIVRGPAETPTEFTSRILSRAVTDDRALRTLLRLYLRTRFGDHPATTDDVAQVRAALRELVATWPALDPAAQPGDAEMSAPPVP
ncbi:MAG TPA: DUF4129 domain-containing protein [Solirubrobacteraceae bacterium]